MGSRGVVAPSIALFAFVGEAGAFSWHGGGPMVVSCSEGGSATSGGGASSSSWAGGGIKIAARRGLSHSSLLPGDTRRGNPRRRTGGAASTTTGLMMQEMLKKPAAGSAERDDSYTFTLPFGQNVYGIITSPVVELTVAVFVLAGCVLQVLETIQIRPLYYNIEDVITYIFIVEYFARWYSRNLRLTYLFKWEMLIDLVAFLPFLLQSDGYLGFTFLRLLRILRLQRFLRDAKTFQRLVRVLPNALQFNVTDFGLQVIRILSQIFTLLFITSGLIYNAERDLNPNLRDFFSAFYFSLTTLTTVGYGDIVPQTPAGRAIMSTFILLGIGLIPYQLGSLAQLFFESRKAAETGGSVVECGACGETAHLIQAVFCFRCGSKIRGPGSAELPTTMDTTVLAGGRGMKDDDDIDLVKFKIFGTETLTRRSPGGMEKEVGGGTPCSTKMPWDGDVNKPTMRDRTWMVRGEEWAEEEEGRVIIVPGASTPGLQQNKVSAAGVAEEGEDDDDCDDNDYEEEMAKKDKKERDEGMKQELLDHIEVVDKPVVGLVVPAAPKRKTGLMSRIRRLFSRKRKGKSAGLTREQEHISQWPDPGSSGEEDPRNRGNKALLR